MTIDNHGRTAETRMVALDVVQQQARVCAVKMENIEDKLDGVVKDMSTVKKDVGEIKTEIAVLKVRIAIGALAIGSLPLVVDLVRDWLSH